MVGVEEFVDEDTQVVPVVGRAADRAVNVPVFVEFDEGGVVGEGVLAANQGGELAVEDAVDFWGEFVHELKNVGVLGRSEDDAVEGVVGVDGLGCVAGASGGVEPSVGGAHGGEAGGTQARDAGTDCDLGEGAQHGEGVVDVSPVDGGDAGVGAGLGFDQAHGDQAGQGFAHGGAAEAELGGQVRVTDRLAGDKF